MFEKFKLLMPLSLIILLSGCSIEKEEKDPEKLLSTEHIVLQPEQMKAFSLSSLSDKLTLKNFDKKVIANNHYIVDYNSNRLKIYDASSMTLVQSLDAFFCQQAPIFVNAHQLIAISDKKLILIDIQHQTIEPISFIDGPVLAKPLVVNSEYIILQYTNNIAQCFNFKGDSLWKTLLPFSSSHYKHSEYHPCADHTHVYLAYPGGPLCKLTLATGLIEWTSKAIMNEKTPTTGFFVSHINQPLHVYGDMILAQTSDNALYMIDTLRGTLVSTIEIAKNSIYKQNDDKLFFIEPSGSLCAYNLKENSMIWRNPIGMSGNILGFTHTDSPMMLVRTEEGILISLNQENGEKHSSLENLPKNYDFFSTESKLYGQDKDGSLIAFNFYDLSH